MSEKKLKCTVRDGRFVEPCDLLEKITEYNQPRGKQKGLFAYTYWLTASDQPARTFYGVKSGEHVEGGMILNYCPMCGEKINDPALPKEKS